MIDSDKPETCAGGNDLLCFVYAQQNADMFLDLELRTGRKADETGFPEHRPLCM